MSNVRLEWENGDFICLQRIADSSTVKWILANHQSNNCLFEAPLKQIFKLFLGFVCFCIYIHPARPPGALKGNILVNSFSGDFLVSSCCQCKTAWFVFQLHFPAAFPTSPIFKLECITNVVLP